MSEIVLTCDTVIIGAGTAGVEAFKAATAEGVNCVLVESGPLGTSAKRSGDTPISTLSAAGRVSHALMELEKHGIKGLYELGLGLDLDQVLNNVRAVRAKDTSEVLSFIYRIAEEKRLIGKARFLDEHSLMVNESHVVRFKTAVIATGATSIIPYELNQYSAQAMAEKAAQEQGEDAAIDSYQQVSSGSVYTPQELFELDHLPNSMAIFGSNREGLQIGQALAYLGVKVVVFGQHHIWKLTDDSVIAAAIVAFKERFDLVLESFTTAIDKYEQGFGIYYMDGTNYENILSVDTILAANVRYPMLEGLNVRSLGMALERSGCIKIDGDTMQTSLPHIFAAGEVTNLDATIVNCRHDGAVAGVNAARQALSMPELPPLEQVAPEDEHESRYLSTGPVTAQPAAAHAYAHVLGLGLTSVKRPELKEKSLEPEETPERLLAAADATLAADLAAETKSTPQAKDSTEAEGYDLYKVRRDTLEQWAHKQDKEQAPAPTLEATKQAPDPAQKSAQSAQAAVHFKIRRPDFKLDILHTDPELAIVGLSYDEVKERARQGHPFVSSEVRATFGRYRITHQEGGILRLYCDAVSHVVLGAEMCLHGAGHLAHFLAQAIVSERTVEQLCELPYFSSSYEEIIKEAAEQALKNIARKGHGL